ncbi:hypothetical protein BH24ACT1_BH24ACT1_00850 [soil metagenome]
MSAGPELSSISTALGDLTSQVTSIAERMERTDREDLAKELFEAERALLGAGRRLSKVVDALNPS